MEMKNNKRRSIYLVILVMAVMTAACSRTGSNESDPTGTAAEHNPMSEQGQLTAALSDTPITTVVSNAPTKSITTEPTGAQTQEDLTTPMATAAPTVTPVPTATNVPTATPLPTQPVGEEPEFMELLRLMPEGTKIDITGISEEELEWCFYTAVLTESKELGLKAQSQVFLPDIDKISLIRILYYRTDGEAYIGEVFGTKSAAGAILKAYREQFALGTQYREVLLSIDDLEAAGLTVTSFIVEGSQCLYIN